MSETQTAMLKMVARNVAVQDIPYSRLFQIPSTDDERDFISLDDLKPTMVHQNVLPQPVHNYEPTYYELTNINE